MSRSVGRRTVPAAPGANLAVGVERILNIRTEHLSPEQVPVCVKVELMPPVELGGVVDRINRTDAIVKQMMPETLTCCVEPDHFDPDRVDADWSRRCGQRPIARAATPIGGPLPVLV